MNGQPTNPSQPSALNDRISAAVRSHRIKIRVLTTVAFLFGFFAIALSIVIVAAYMVLYLPKDKQIMRDAERAAFLQTKVDSPDPVEKQQRQFLGATIHMTHALSMGVTIMAVATGVLAVGTLILLAVVVLNRRVALNQIKASLTQISEQIRQLEMSQSSIREPPGGR